ncbi:Hypothetical predicted protein [Pelobates cultripes]|uniref:Uncharacterized protein n=1 Tax=Pelobates cultripes TaxID=61616 RepID=A0AAD1WAC2_PELCU|nr:Hypothetical predicted protein [Pelobates cultripes]
MRAPLDNPTLTNKEPTVHPQDQGCRATPKPPPGRDITGLPRLLPITIQHSNEPTRDPTTKWEEIQRHLTSADMHHLEEAELATLETPITLANYYRQYYKTFSEELLPKLQAALNALLEEARPSP